jgi:molecular chaperone HtpG
MFRERGIDAVLLQHVLDNHFITFLENHNPGVKFRRIDSDLSELTEKGRADVAVETLFAGHEGVKTVDSAAFAAGGAPAVLVLSEESRRMREMAKMFGGMEGMEAMFPTELTLTLNSAHPLYARLGELASSNPDRAKLLAEHIYDLARMAQEPLGSEDLTRFIARSAEIMLDNN